MQILSRGEPIPNSTHDRIAFTLIELFVVVAVIAVLAGLLLPALAQTQRKARGISCLNHLKQWGLAMQLYAADHDDYLPQEGSPNPGASSTNVGWYVSLPRQLALPPYHTMPWRTNANAPLEPGSTLWICPANPRRSNGRNLFHYCVNEHLNGTGRNNHPVKLSALPAPSRLVWMFDSKNLPAVGYWGFVHTNLHDQGAQFSFLDGHVARYQNTEYWDFDRNRGRTDHPELRWVP